MVGCKSIRQLSVDVELTRQPITCKSKEDELSTTLLMHIFVLGGVRVGVKLFSSGSNSPGP